MPIAGAACDSVEGGRPERPRPKACTDRIILPRLFTGTSLPGQPEPSTKYTASKMPAEGGFRLPLDEESFTKSVTRVAERACRSWRKARADGDPRGARGNRRDRIGNPQAGRYQIHVCAVLG